MLKLDNNFNWELPNVWEQIFLYFYNNGAYARCMMCCIRQFYF